LLADANSDEDQWVREAAAKALADRQGASGEITSEMPATADVWGAAV